LGKYTCRIISITKEEGEQELWFFHAEGKDHAMYLPQGTTIEDAAQKIVKTIKKIPDSRLGQYELIEGVPPKKLKTSAELEMEIGALKDAVEELKKLKDKI